MAYAAFWVQSHKKDGSLLEDRHSTKPSLYSLLEDRHSTKPSLYTARSYHAKSQPGQATPKPAAQVSTVKPAQFETSSSSRTTMATKPGAVTTATGGLAGRGVAAGGSATVGTAGKAENTSASQVQAAATLPSSVTGTAGGSTFGTSGGSTAGIGTMGGSTATTGTYGRPTVTIGPSGGSSTTIGTSGGSTATIGTSGGSTATIGTSRGSTATISTSGGSNATIGTSGGSTATISTSGGSTATIGTPGGSTATIGTSGGSTATIGTSGGTIATIGPSGGSTATFGTSGGSTATIGTLGGSTATIGTSGRPTSSGSAATTALSQQKPGSAREPAQVQVEVPSAGVKVSKEAPEVDPLDELASILPSANTIVVPEPEYTGPEIIESGVTSEEGVLCGERDDTLPPGYRWEDMGPPPADWKPPEVPKPLTTEEALDSLSFGFTSSTTPACPKEQKKMDDIDSVSATSAGPTNFGAPPADKKPKMEKGADYLTGITATPFKKSSPPCEKKVKEDTNTVDFSLKAGLDTKAKPKTKGGAMPLDALSALGDLLPADVPKPEEPKLRPEDIVSEGKHKEEDAVLVGERDDTIPEEYRFNKEELEKLPAPKPEPTMATSDALDILSGDFTSSSAGPTVCPPAPCLQPIEVPAAAGDFSLEAGLTDTSAEVIVEKISTSEVLFRETVDESKVSGTQASAPPSTASEVIVEKISTSEVIFRGTVGEGKVSGTQASAPPSTASEGKQQDTKPKIGKGDSFSLDALNALSDTLPADVPKPQSPKLRPEDIVSEGKHTEEDAVLCGEREDSIHPDHRFNKEELEKLPAPKPEPTMGTGEALDLLSEDFSMPAAKPSAVQTPCLSSTVPPTQSSSDFALDALAGEFVSSTAAAKVESGADLQLEAGADGALDALSDTLNDIKPAPMPEPALPKNIVDEKKAVEERLIKMGERDDSLPPEYRPTEEELKKMKEYKEAEAAKPKPTMDDKTALDLLSDDFSDIPKPAASGGACAASTKLESDPQKSMSGPVLEKLSDTLLPDKQEFKSKGDKPKKHAEESSAAETLPTSLSSDVVAASTRKGGKR